MQTADQQTGPSPAPPSTTAGKGRSSPDSAGFISGRNVDYGPFVSVPAMFDVQADRRPGYPALSFAGTTLTYRRLEHLANGLAAELSGNGVRRGDLVPVLMANRLELPIAYLAAMKLGAVFVPLDPSWPHRRVQAALGVLSGPLVLCDAASAALDIGRTLVVDAERISPTARRPAVSPRADEPIYGIFTSGTTGTPKCAVNRHGGLANRFRFMSRYFGATGDEVVLQNSKHTFDSSIWQLFWPLTVGGHTVLPAPREFLNLHHTIETIAEYRITASDFVSSIFNALVAIVDRDPSALPKLASLRWLIVGSEPVNPRAVHRLMSLLPDLRVTNGYGPTETSIGMAFHPMSPEDGDSVPVGRPIDNCYAAIVDDRLRPLPSGATGEIVVGGACLGEGYLGSPAATARAFVPNPVPDSIPGDRLYLTGDVGHLDDEGRLFFSGRKDFQVKIDGVRIELGEIASTADGCPGVTQAEVLVADEAAGKSLALFVACDAALSETVLREHMRHSLPRTSVPGYYFLLPAMPLSENGKVDRSSLRAMLDRRLADDAARLADQAPVTDLAGRVLRLMRSALGRPDLAAYEHFMDAGGDSLKALTVVNTIRDDWRVPQVCAQDLLDHPTADRLALVVEAYRGDAAAVESETALMERDAVVRVDEPIRAADRHGPLRSVLVTGATGFLGNRLVHELLRGGDLRVFCLTRAGDDARARARVVGALAERGLWEPGFGDRIRCHAADLSLPKFGLSAHVWDELARTCDLVLHSAALVNFLFDYRAHRRINVLGTAELLRLAMTHRPVPLHHVSTLAALQGAAGDRRHPLGEDYEPHRIPSPPGGYNRSKWVAERYLEEARRRGALVTVLRLGEVMPAADNGRPNPLALTHLLLSAFHRLRLRPDADIHSDYTPLDYAAARIVAEVFDRTIWGETLHVYHPESVAFGDVLTAHGAVSRTSCVDFLSRLHAEVERTGDRELSTLAALLPDPGTADEAELRRVFDNLLTDNPALYGKDNCRRAERRWGLSDPPLIAPVAAYRDYLARRYPGDPLPAPAAVPQRTSAGGAAGGTHTQHTRETDR